MPVQVRLGHVAVPAQNPRELAQFYRDFLGLSITLEGSLPLLGDFVFLSDRPDDDPQTLAFMTRPESRHIAWKVESLAALKAVHADARARGVRIVATLNHGVSLSLLLRDPEGNAIEVYWLTGRTTDGLYAEPLDLDQSDDDLLASLDAVARA